MPGERLSMRKIREVLRLTVEGEIIFIDRPCDAGDVRVCCENCLLLWPKGSGIGDLPFFDIGRTLQFMAPDALTSALMSQGFRHAA